MKIEGKLTFKSERADELVSIIARSLAPDNVSEMETVIDDNEVKVKFKGNKVGTVLSSVDDYLMNAKIASDMLNLK
jgi:hypothetical protein